MIRRPAGPRPLQLLLLLAAALALALAPISVIAQPYARFAVPDSALAPALRAAGSQYENAWNALLATQLRAELARADSAAALLRLASRVAAAEPGALGSHIAPDALALRARWTLEQKRARVRAAVAESLGVAARRSGEADSLLGSALADYRRLGERRREAWVLGSLGTVAFNARDWPRADSLYREALAARRAVGDSSLVGRALNSLGSIAMLSGRHPEAYAYYQQARSVREGTGERALLGRTYNYLGLLAYHLGQPDTAAARFRQALDLTESQGDSALTTEVLINYGLLEGARDPARAMSLNDRGLAICRARGDLRHESMIEQNIGELSRELGRGNEAVAHLGVAAALAQKSGDLYAVAGSLLSLGATWIGLSDAAGARPPLERALALSDSLGDLGTRALALDDLAITARLAGDPGGAAQFAERALHTAEDLGDSALVHLAATTLGQLALDARDRERAAVWFTRAAAAGVSGEMGEAWRASDLNNLGTVAVLADRLEEAERHFQASVEAAERAGVPDQIWPALDGLGEVAERRGEFAQALAYSRRAATLIDTLRTRVRVRMPALPGDEARMARDEALAETQSIKFFGGRLFAFEALIHLLARLQPRFPDSAYSAEGFAWSERARARAFLDLVAASGAQERRTSPLTLAQAQRLLGSDRDALLEYSLGDSSSSLWVITRRGWSYVPLPPRAALRARAERLRRGLANAEASMAPATQAAAFALYRTLIEPALPRVKGVDHLIVAPDGVLALLPFEALLAVEPKEDQPPDRGAYLVERFAISYIPSATTLAVTGGSLTAAGIVALGDPDYGAGASAGGPAGAGAVRSVPSLPRLPNTGAEVEALRSLAGKRTLAELTGARATRERLLALPLLPHAELIHIATHGEANEADPARSGLWLAASGAAGPGFLSVGDILGLRLDARLVTLSACETGLGRLERGEGVLGLTRAFLAAGAQSVVVSLWKVNDRSSALLMERFYRDLLQRGSPRAVALAVAKRGLLSHPETRAPFYWAPFVLVGQAGELE